MLLSYFLHTPTVATTVGPYPLPHSQSKQRSSPERGSYTSARSRRLHPNSACGSPTAGHRCRDLFSRNRKTPGEHRWNQFNIVDCFVCLNQFTLPPPTKHRPCHELGVSFRQNWLCWESWVESVETSYFHICSITFYHFPSSFKPSQLGLLQTFPRKNVPRDFSQTFPSRRLAGDVAAFPNSPGTNLSAAEIFESERLIKWLRKTLGKN